LPEDFARARNWFNSFSDSRKMRRLESFLSSVNLGLAIEP